MVAVSRVKANKKIFLLVLLYEVLCQWLVVVWFKRCCVSGCLWFGSKGVVLVVACGLVQKVLC